MRSHGEPSFPDPVLKESSVTFGAGPDIDQDSPRFVSVTTTCKRLVPDGGAPSPAQIQTMIAQMVKNAECMRGSWDNELPGPDRERPRQNCRFQPQRPGPEFAPVPRRPEGLPETCTAGSGRMNVVR